MEPKCLVYDDCNLVCLMYEEALRRGYEAQWHRLTDNGLYVVTVSYINAAAFFQLLADVWVTQEQSRQLTLFLTAEEGRTVG